MPAKLQSQRTAQRPPQSVPARQVHVSMQPTHAHITSLCASLPKATAHSSHSSLRAAPFLKRVTQSAHVLIPLLCVSCTSASPRERSSVAKREPRLVPDKRRNVRMSSNKRSVCVDSCAFVTTRSHASNHTPVTKSIASHALLLNKLSKKKLIQKIRREQRRRAQVAAVERASATQ